MLTARTLAEAQTYLSLMAAADDAPDAAQPAPPATSLTEGEEAWTVHSEFGDIAVPYLSEDAARKLGIWFGLGVSQLIDAGQWILVAGTYARRAIDADVAYTGQPGQDRDSVELNWQFAAEAIGEALKFFPDGADRLPDEAFWSELGQQVQREQPDRITRAQLTDDQEYYIGTLEDFRSLYGESS